MTTKWLEILCAAVAVLAAGGCDRTVGTLDLWIVTSADEAENPFTDLVDRIRVRVEAPDLGVVVGEFPYAPGASLTVDEVTVGSGRTIVVEALTDGGMVLARGRSLPIDVTDGDNSLELYVAWLDRFSSAAAPTYGPGVAEPRGGHRGVTLDDGRVVFVGGGASLDTDSLELGAPSRSVALFDPTAGRFVDVGVCRSEIPGADPLCTSVGRVGAGVGRTPRGDVLIAGGRTESGPAVQIERMRAGALTFEVIGEPISARLWPAFTTTADGAALLGGRAFDGAPLDSAVLFDSTGERAQVVESLLECPRSDASVVRVAQWALLFGGFGADGVRADYELVPVDPEVRRGACRELAPEIEPRSGASLTVIEDRFVIIAGGLTAPDDRGVRQASREIDLFDAETNIMCPAGALTTARALHGAAALPGDRVIVIGGLRSTGHPTPLPSFEVLWLGELREVIDGLGIAVSCDDLQGLLLVEQQPLAIARTMPSVAALGNGAVVVDGGFDAEGAAVESTEIFVPTR